MVAGRPIKEKAIFSILTPDKLYLPATVAGLAVESEILAHLSVGDRSKERRRIRLRVGSMIRKHRLLFGEGDGLILLPGQSPKRAWFGMRYLVAVGFHTEAELYRFLKVNRQDPSVVVSEESL